MTPRTATATATAPRRAPRPAPPALRPVPREPERSRWQRLRRRLSPMGIAAALVVVSLVAVVVGNMQLAAGQLHLEQVNQQLVAVQSSYAAAVEHLTYLESPKAVAADVAGRGLTHPTEVLQVPWVALRNPLPPPHFSYLPCCSLSPGR